MTPEILLVLIILLATVGLFLWDRIRLDVTALLSLLALSLSGILTPAEALAGFADPIVVMIAALFVVGDGLFQTGVAAAMGRIPGRIAGESEVGLLVVVMLMVAVLSGFLSSTGTVAVMLPVVVGLAHSRNIPPSRLLIPMAIASLLGGMLTLIGTAPNIVVSNLLESQGREPFGFFAFTPVGLVMVVLGVGFMALMGRHLLPDRETPGTGPPRDRPTGFELARSYRLTSLLVEVAPGSPLAGARLRDLSLPEHYGATVTGIVPGERRTMGGTGSGRLRPPPFPGIRRPVRRDAPRTATGAGPDTLLEEGDQLQVQIPPDRAALFVRRAGVHLLPDEEARVTSGTVGLAEVLLTPRSRLLGHTLRELSFRERYRVTALAIKRMGELFPDEPRETSLRFGDTLLVKGPWDAIRLLQREHRDFVVIAEPEEMEAALRPAGRAPVAVGILVVMMTLMTLNVVPAVTAVLLAAVAMVLTKCVTVEDGYRSINWESVVLIAAILPMATALQKTGALALAVGGLSEVLGGASPLVLMATLFLLTSTLSQVISNTATAVLIAPLAWGLATAGALNPEPLLMTVAVAASTAFATPMASPVNTLVLGPGGYRFGDFFRVGALLQAFVLAATLVLVPLLFPF